MKLKIPTIKTPFGLWSKTKKTPIPNGKGADTNSGPGVDGSCEQLNLNIACSHEAATLSSGSLFEHQKSAITDESRAALLDYSTNGLGIDPSSEHFMQRKKSIAYAIVVKGQVFCLQTDWFLQPAKYNDFSGGYKRSYKLLPEKLVRKELSDFVLSFHRKFNLPDGAIILLQLQQSIVETNAANDDNGGHPSSNKNDITGQGIHTDGLDCAAILCIERTHVKGALNSLYADLDGEETILEPINLCEGDALFFQDNSLYHYVSDAEPIDSSKDLKRTVLIAHYPSHFLLTGKENFRNVLKRKDSFIKLRQMIVTKSDGCGTDTAHTIENTEHCDGDEEKGMFY